jgi:hypothetical protein
MIMKRNLEMLGLVLAVIMSIGSMVAYFTILPYRMDAQEARSKAIEERTEELSKQRNLDHELLTRIEERLIALQKSIDRK